MFDRSQRSFLRVILSSLGWPVLYGLAGCLGFYAVVHWGLDSLPISQGATAMLRRYFAGHVVEYIETALFCVGLAALAVHLLRIFGQFAVTHRLTLDDAGLLAADTADTAGADPADAATALTWLERQAAAIRDSYLGRRLREALDRIARQQSTEGLDDELKYLADLDAARQSEGYGLVRILIWATPMLGFLGTVMGITIALGELSPEALVEQPQEAMKGLLAGLSVAFDTTALALTLSIVLMFLQFLVEQIETQLLAVVDRRAKEEIMDRFATTAGANDPHLAPIQRMSQMVVKACDQLVRRQAELWQESLAAAHSRWNEQAAATGQQLAETLTGGLERSLARHAAAVADTEQALANGRREQEAAWRAALAETVAALRAQQGELARQAAVLTQAVEAAGEVTQLETALNRNLSALAGAQHFEQAVMSLSAAANLLSARLEPAAARVDLAKSSSQGRAA